MAAHIEFGTVLGAGASVYGGLRHAETITTTTSATTEAAKDGDFAAITAKGAAIYFTVGASPTALSTGVDMRYVPDGVTRDIGPLKEGDKIAAIDAA